MKRILWVGDAVVSSGFAQCTHAVCDNLHASGWDVHVLGINYHGDPHPYPYKIYPCYNPLKGGTDGFGVHRMKGMLDDVNPDVVVLLNDPWNIPNYMAAIDFWRKESKDQGPPIVGWLAVDAKNLPKGAVNGLDCIVTWTDFARDEIRLSGYKRGPMAVVPLGVDGEIFRPIPKSEARSRVIIDGRPLTDDDFVVGCVGRNQFRKRLDLTIEYFAEFVSQFHASNAKLLIHAAPTGEEAYDLGRLAEYYGVSGQLLLSQGTLGSGLDSRIMPVIYSVMDTLITTTQGEGWGLCTLEAMSCGVPCIVPGWSGLGDWAADGAIVIPCTSSGITAPRNAPGYTIGGVPDKAETVSALGRLYQEPDLRMDYSERGVQLASTLPWTRSAIEFQAVLESIVEV